MYIYELTWPNSIRHRLAIRRMTAYGRRIRTGVVQPDKSWQVLVPFVVSVGAFCVAFVRWWLCV